MWRKKEKEELRIREKQVLSWGIAFRKQVRVPKARGRKK